MERWRFALCALSICFAASALAGCASPSSSATSLAPAARSSERSWMLPQASGDTLLYTTGPSDVYAIAFPSGKLVGTITSVSYPQGVCSDAAGNIFVTSYRTQDVVEFAHGGTTPIAKLADFGYFPLGCAVDPTTGNLAVANMQAMDGSGGNVAIYTGAIGKPTYYTALGMSGYSWCTYDDRGDLFVSGGGVSGLAELPAGSQTMDAIALSVAGNGLQWDGRYLAMLDRQSKVIYRISVSGSSGSVVGTAHLKGLIASVGWDFVLDGDKAVVPYAPKGYDLRKFGFWKYPRGGQRGRSFSGGGYDYQGVTLSNSGGLRR